VPHQPDDDDNTFDQYQFHMNEIGKVIHRWRTGEISTPAKRQAIADENRSYYHGERKSPVTGDWITSVPRSDGPAGVLADAAGIQIGAMTSALRARRAASVLAQQITDGGGTREAALVALADGLAAYSDITGAAAPPPGGWRPS
jgi:hypothetical protein